MTGQDEPDAVPMCTVCGESVDNQPFVALGAFGVQDAEGSAFLFVPDGDPADVADWAECPMGRALHFGCLQIYFDGVLADLHRKATQRGSDADEAGRT